MHQLKLSMLTLIVGVLLLAATAFAQNTTATIFGTVTDSSGAVVAGARVTATEIATRLTRTVASDSSGNYAMPLLPVGTYSLQVEASGFKRSERTGITLQLEQRVGVDVVLEVGATTETVNVTDQLSVTEAYTSERGEVIGSKEIRELPLNGRNFTHLMRLTPGAIHYGANNNSTTPDDSRPRITFGNISSVYNRYLLDGANNTDFHDSQTVINPSIEAIQEFNVKGNHYNAEYGGGGGVVNATIKSGTNQLHRTAFEFLRNDNLDARPFFSPSRGEFRYNQFGGVLSGPVTLPKKIFGPLGYEGENRTFFLFNYEGLRVRTPSDRLLRVPTLLERNGDFSALTYDLYDPFNPNAAGLRPAFAGKQIPRNRWSPYAARILEYYPLSNMALNSNNQNYRALVRNTTDADQFTGRVDHRFSERWSVFGRYSQSKRADVTGESFVGAGGNLVNNNGRQTVAGLTGVLSANLISETRFGFARFTFIPEQNTRLDRNFDAELGFPYAATINPIEYGFPAIVPTGFTSLGTPRFRAFGPNNSWNVNQSFTLARGNHSWKFGGSWEQNRAETSFFVARTWNFNGSYTALVQGGRFTTAGSGFADFLLGLPQQITFGPTLPGIGRTSNIITADSYGFFAQDDWKVNRRLTINYGLRYELNLPPVEVNGRTLIGEITKDGKVNYPRSLKVDDQFLPTQFPTARTVDGVNLPAGAYFNRVDRERLWNVDKNNFQPRIGLAFLPFGNEKTVIRASGGLFNGRNSGKLGFTAGLGAPFFIQQIERQDQTGRPGILRLGELPAASFTTAGTFQYNVIPLDNPDPFIQSWTLSVQRELPGQFLFEASYLGNRAYHVSSTLQLNVRRVPGAENGVGCGNSCPTARPFPRTYPQFDEERTRGPFGWSNYHGGVLKLERRFTNGLAFLSSFTWSKGIDSGSFVVGDDIGGGQGPGVGANNVFNLRAERGRSALNVERRFVANWVYDLPFKSGGNALVNGLVSGWQLSGIVTLQSGFWFTPLAPTDLSGDGQVNDRVNRIRDGNLPSDQRTLARWFDTGAFEQQPLNTFGNAGRTILEGPGTAIVDLGVFRQFKFKERHNIQFRAEFFNAFNHANFAIPNRTLGQPTYGIITGTSSGPRNIQLALKYLF